MPPSRSPSLSFAEPRSRPLLQDWVDGAISEGLLRARKKGAPVLHVSTRTFDAEIPFSAFDSSSLDDVQFFGGRDRLVLGLGVAKAVEPASRAQLGEEARRDLLELAGLSSADATKVTIIGGWGLPQTRRAGRSEIWRDFPNSRWVVPALMIASEGGSRQITLAVHVTPRSRVAKLRASYRTLVQALEPQTEATRDVLPALEGARSTPPRGRWTLLAREAIDSISRDQLKKVVLSRGVTLAFRDDLPVSVVLRRLIDLNPDSTVFAIKRRRSVFMGASPEGLISVKNKGDVEVDCLAASSPRSDDRETDDTLGAGLLRDPKSSREHQLVVQAALSALSPLCSSLEVPAEPVLKKLTTIQHLHTPLRARLFEGEDVWSAALALWPNPALHGEPRAEAVRWIHDFEGLDRGWFSGVVGVVNGRQDEAELVVGLRSGVIRGRKAIIYAGAGIVAGSKPDEEFQETTLKLRTMGRALGVDVDRLG